MAWNIEIKPKPSVVADGKDVKFLQSGVSRRVALAEGLRMSPLAKMDDYCDGR